MAISGFKTVVLIAGLVAGQSLTSQGLGFARDAKSQRKSSNRLRDQGPWRGFDPIQYEDYLQDTKELEGSGYDDYLDSDGEDFGHWNRPEIVSSRVVPISSSPVFNYQGGSYSTSYNPPANNGYQAAAPAGRNSGGRNARVPSRPDRLNSYYPGVTAEGSGDDGGFVINTHHGRVEHNYTDLISPSKPTFYQPTSSIVFEDHNDMVTNHKPLISNRLDTLALTAGKSSRIIIPANTFQDLEDGDTRDLSLDIVLTGEDETLEDLTWVRFDKENQEIVALPLEDMVGIWKFKVIATDKGGESVTDILEMHVRQHSSSRLFHHILQLTVTPVSPWNFQHPMEWKLELLEAIYQFFGDRDPGRISVLEAKESGSDYKFSWTNDTLQQQRCPRDEVLAIFNKLNMGQQIAPGFKAILKDDFLVKDVELSWRAMCSDGGPPPGSVPPSGFDNSMPQIRNPVDRISIMAGELLYYQVPDDMCYDSENGPTRYLDLSLLTPQRLEVATTNWLQFDKKNQEFYGVPLEMDVGREAYQLVCADSQGLMAIDGIEVHVVSRPFDERFNMEYVFVFNDTLDDGSRLMASRVRMAKTIAKIFNDNDTGNVVLKNIDPITMEVTWYNKTIKDRHCPGDYLQKAKKFLMDQDGKPRPHVVNSFPSEFHLSDIKMIPIGYCITVTTTEPPEDDDFPLQIPHQEYILTFVVPALIIIAMLLFAILIACLLHRKRRAGKMEILKAESLPPRIPVIMQDELSDDNFNVSKQPIILREEQPAMGTMGGSMGGYGHTSFGGQMQQPPNYYGGPSSRMEEEFSECESLVNGNPSVMPHLSSHYSRPPPVSLDFSDTLSRSRMRPAPAYQRKQPPHHFNP